jgi:hypothetical protein
MYLINCYQIMKIGHCAVENWPLSVKIRPVPSIGCAGVQTISTTLARWPICSELTAAKSRSASKDGRAHRFGDRISVVSATFNHGRSPPSVSVYKSGQRQRRGPWGNILHDRSQGQGDKARRANACPAARLVVAAFENLVQFVPRGNPRRRNNL